MVFFVNLKLFFLFVFVIFCIRLIFFFIFVFVLENLKNSVGIFFYIFGVVVLFILIIFICILFMIFIVVIGMFVCMIFVVVEVVLWMEGKVMIVIENFFGMIVSLSVVFVIRFNVFFELINRLLRLYLVEDLCGWCCVLIIVLFVRIIVKLMI